MFEKKLPIFISVLLTTTFINADEKRGEELFMEAKCLECHETTSFKHNEKKVNNIHKLKQKVKACEFNTNTGWFDDEVMDVVDYLNKKYYHYK